MHMTTLRFGDALWAELVRAAAAENVSVAQYLREAAALRIAAQRGAPADRAAEWSKTDRANAVPGTTPPTVTAALPVITQAEDAGGERRAPVDELRQRSDERLAR